MQTSRKLTRAQQEARIGLLLLSPWLIGFILLKALPILAALAFSFTDFYMLEPGKTQFVGLANYIHLAQDAQAGISLFGSFSYFLLTVPLEMFVALGLAALFTSPRLKQKRLLGTLVFMTSIIPGTSVLFVLNGSQQYLQRLWVDVPNSLPQFTGFGWLPFFLSLWSIGPGFLIMLSAMESVAPELYEAARVDGAGPIMRFVGITLPMISPAIFFTLVINLTGAFGGALLLDRGYFLGQSLSPIEGYINQTMFREGQLGYASTLAWAIFAIMMSITVFLFRSSRRWVYFPEEDENVEI